MVRSEAAINHINAAVEQSDTRGGRRYPGRKTPATSDRLISNGLISIFSENYLLNSQNTIHELDFQQIQAFSKRLFEINIQPSATFAVTLDHFEYWCWTAAVASYTENIELETGNLQSLIHFASFPIRVTSSALPQNPAIGGVLMRRWHLIQIALFSVLEGLLTEYIDTVSQTETGIKANQEIECTWAPDEKVDDWQVGQKINGYNHLVQIWREYGTYSSDIKSILDSINEIGNYDMNSIRWKFDDSDDIIDEELSDGSNNFLRLITNYRNKNIHGEEEAYRVSPILMTLCCLAIWDILTEYEYAEIRDSTIQQIQMTQNQGNRIHPLWPASFYPVTTVSQVRE